MLGFYLNTRLIFARSGSLVPMDYRQFQVGEEGATEIKVKASVNP